MFDFLNLCLDLLLTQALFITATQSSSLIDVKHDEVIFYGKAVKLWSWTNPTSPLEITDLLSHNQIASEWPFRWFPVSPTPAVPYYYSNSFQHVIYSTLTSWLNWFGRQFEENSKFIGNVISRNFNNIGNSNTNQYPFIYLQFYRRIYFAPVCLPRAGLRTIRPFLSRVTLGFRLGL